MGTWRFAVGTEFEECGSCMEGRKAEETALVLRGYECYRVIITSGFDVRRRFDVLFTRPA